MAQLINATDKWDKLKKDVSKTQKIKEILPLVMKKNDKARANLAKAFIEDEAIKAASVQNSISYLERCDEADRTPFWQWCTLYFILGMLFMITIDNLSYNWTDIIQFWKSYK